jgi:DNA-binding CsgD family transcriptional regulator
MGHLIVFAGILILTIGFTVVYQGIQIHRAYRFPAVRAFVLYIALYNLVGLMTLIAQYLIRNVGPIASDGMYILVIVMMGSIGFTLAAIETSMFAATVWHLSGMIRAPQWFVYGYGLICVSWLAAFVIGTFRFLQHTDRQFLLHVHAAIVLTLIAVFFLLPLLLLIKSRHIQPERHKRMARTFGLFFVSLSCMDIGALFLPSQWDVFLSMLSGLVLNLCLLLYFKSFVAAYYGPIVPAADPNLNLNGICEEFHFSARERDIIQMILRGKSNKEIEQELFISSHTVKNHIYHIFQKAGIKSRGQLVSIILQNSADVVHQR